MAGEAEGLGGSEEEEMRPKGNFSFKYPSHLRAFPPTKSLQTMGLAQPRYPGFAQDKWSETAEFLKAVKVFLSSSEADTWLLRQPLRCHPQPHGPWGGLSLDTRPGWEGGRGSRASRRRNRGRD